MAIKKQQQAQQRSVKKNENSKKRVEDIEEEQEQETHYSDEEVETVQNTSKSNASDDEAENASNSSDSEPSSDQDEQEENENQKAAKKKNPAKSSKSKDDEAEEEEEEELDEDSYDLIGANLVRRGMFIMLKDHVAKVESFSNAKPGKHGHAKSIIMAKDPFTNKRVEDSVPAQAKLKIAPIQKLEWLIEKIDEDESLVDLKDPKSGKVFKGIKYDAEEDYIAKLFKSPSKYFVSVIKYKQRIAITGVRERK